MEEGVQELTFNASSLASGVYFYRIAINTVDNENDGAIGGQVFTSIRKMLLVK